MSNTTIDFFFVLAAKKIIPGENVFLLATLRVDKRRLLLFDRNVGHFHSFLKSVHDPKLMFGHFALTDNFFSCSVFHFLSCLEQNTLRLEDISKHLTTLKFSAQCMMEFLPAGRNYNSIFQRISS